MASPHMPHMPVLQSDSLNGPVAIFWDIENCPVPSDVRPGDAANNIIMALARHRSIKRPIPRFRAYVDTFTFPQSVRRECYLAGADVLHVSNNGRKDVAEEAILFHMLEFALDNRPPSSIVLICGDLDLAPALIRLGQRGYTVILVIPSRICVSSALCNVGIFIWDWASIARGECFVPSRAYIPRGSDLSGYLPSNNFGDCPETQIEDEAIVCKGSRYTSCNISSNSRESSKAAQSFSECNNINSSFGALFFSSRAETQLSSQGLKDQLVRLIEISGGSLRLDRVASEYARIYGRPLRMSEYGVINLVDLIENMMADVLILPGKGPERYLCLRTSRHDKKYGKQQYPDL